MSQSVDTHDRQVRAAKNQSVFREINERARHLEADSNVVAPAKTSVWFCECAVETCFEHITMPHDEYNSIREDGARFFVAIGDEHVWPDVELVTEKNDRYWIVEKIGDAERIARRLDPRSKPLPLKT